MGWATDSAVEVFKKSFDYKSLYWSYFLIGLLAFVAFAIISAVIIIIPAYMLIMPYLLPLLQMDPNPAAVLLALQSLLQALPQIIIGFAIILIIFTIVSTFLDSFFSGLQLNIALDYLKKAKFSIGKAIAKTKPRFLVLFALNIIFIVILGIVQLILMLPAISSISGLLNSFASVFGAGGFYTMVDQSFAQNLVLQLSTIQAQANFANWTYLIIAFFLSPFLVMIAPIALFEKRGISASLRRIFELGKKGYLSTLGYFILLALLAIIAIIVFVIAFFISLLLMFVLVGIPLLIVVLIAFMLWLMAFSNLATAKLYQVKASMK